MGANQQCSEQPPALQASQAEHILPQDLNRRHLDGQLEHRVRCDRQACESDRVDSKEALTFDRRSGPRGEVLSRPVAFFGIDRTVPAGEKPSFKKLKGPSYRHSGTLSPLPEDALTEVERVLGKSVREFRQTQIERGQTFYTGRNSGNEYSEFHFGAGESSIIRIISEIETLPENALILIEEIENGLHPVATRRLVEYLVIAAQRKRIQAIFTTHSDEALSPLPSEAIWACLDSRVQQGKLSVRTLCAVSGKIDTGLAIFVEDEFAKHWVEAIIRYELPEAYDQVEVHAVAGDGIAVSIHRSHMADPSMRFRSLLPRQGSFACCCILLTSPTELLLGQFSAQLIV